jgi:hypothetical protein
MHTSLIVLGGIAVGAFIGYQFSGSLQMYQPYSGLYRKFRPGVVTQIQTNSSVSGQVAGAVAVAPVVSLVNEGKEVYSELQGLFN